MTAINPRVTTDRKVNSHFARSKSELHPLTSARNNGHSAQSPTLTINHAIRDEGRRKFGDIFFSRLSLDAALWLTPQGQRSHDIHSERETLQISYFGNGGAQPLDGVNGNFVAD